MAANKIAIATKVIVIVNRSSEFEAALTGVGVGVELEDDGAGVGLKATFAGIVTVCVGLQALVVPEKT